MSDEETSLENFVMWFKEDTKGLDMSHDNIARHVRGDSWQKFRLSLKGLSTASKLSKLRKWLRDHGNSTAAQIQVRNYIGALQRGGQLSAGDKPKIQR